MAVVYDVPATVFVVKAGQKLKETGKIVAPEWAADVKTGYAQAVPARTAGLVLHEVRLHTPQDLHGRPRWRAEAQVAVRRQEEPRRKAQQAREKRRIHHT